MILLIFCLLNKTVKGLFITYIIQMGVGGRPKVGKGDNKTKVESVQLGKPPTEPRVLKKVCVVVVGSSVCV